MSKLLFHVDLDQFFAAVEMRDNPNLRGKPILVGGSASNRGVVTTASYEARKFGVHSGMAMHEALKLCPQAICVRSDGGRYVDASTRVREILISYTDLVEFISIDEAAMDITDIVWRWPSITALAEDIQRRVVEEVGITTSIGAGATRHVAKMASGMKKPNGFTYLPPSKVAEAFRNLPIGDMIGVGQSTEHVLRGLGIRTIGDLSVYPTDVLRSKFGKRGPDLQILARGGGRDVVTPAEELPQEKSMSHETTFHQDQTSRDAILGRIMLLTERVAHRMRHAQLMGKVVAVTIRYRGFETVHQQKKLARFVYSESDIFTAVKRIFDELWDSTRPVRLVGVDISHLVSTHAITQQELFTTRQERDALIHVCDDIKKRYGGHMIGYASNLFSPQGKSSARRGRQFGAISFRFDGMNGR